MIDINLFAGSRRLALRLRLIAFKPVDLYELPPDTVDRSRVSPIRPVGRRAIVVDMDPAEGRCAFRSFAATVPSRPTSTLTRGTPVAVSRSLNRRQSPSGGFRLPRILAAGVAFGSEWRIQRAVHGPRIPRAR